MDPLIKAGFTDYKFLLGSLKDLPGFVKPQSKRKNNERSVRNLDQSGRPGTRIRRPPCLL